MSVGLGLSTTWRKRERQHQRQGSGPLGILFPPTPTRKPHCGGTSHVVPDPTPRSSVKDFFPSPLILSERVLAKQVFLCCYISVAFHHPGGSSAPCIVCTGLCLTRLPPQPRYEPCMCRALRVPQVPPVTRTHTLLLPTFDVPRVLS